MAMGQLSKVVKHLRSVLVKQDAAGLADGNLLNLYVRERDEAAFEALVRRHGPMLQHADAGKARLHQPVSQRQAGPVLVRLQPDLPEVRQGFIEAQGPLQPSRLLFPGIEVLRVLQEQPADALEELLASGGEFMKQDMCS
jgi:hypothetical protein